MAEHRPRADATTLRRWFNEMLLWERVQRGQLTTKVVYEHIPRTYASVGEPRGTKSQAVEYWDGDTRLAVVHQYLRPDGSIGGSGRPDPKLVRHDGVEYVLGA